MSKTGLVDCCMQYIEHAFGHSPTPEPISLSAFFQKFGSTFLCVKILSSEGTNIYSFK
jgi:hypothetical protein